MPPDPGPLSPAELSCLPIFPLPDAVLFPGTLLPLHVFEARYRDMMAWTLERDLPIVVAQLSTDPIETPSAQPHIFPVAGVGRLHRHTRRPDGRYDIILRGVARVRLVEELVEPAMSFRRGRFEEVPDLPFDRHAGAAALATLQGILLSLAAHRPRLAMVLHQLVTPNADVELVSNLLASMLIPCGESRQELLQDRDAVERLDVVICALADLLPDPEADANAS